MATFGSLQLRVFGMAILLLLAAGSWGAAAQVPQKLNYQGFLTNSTSQPLDVPAGVPMTFALFDVLTSGAALYSESQSVAVNKGVFNVVIGSVTPLTLSFDVPYFLEVTVNGETLTPRQPLASSAYALRSGCIPGDRVTCYDAATGTPGVNNCQTGTRTCNAQGTGWSACTGEVVPCGSGTTCCLAPQTCGGGGTPGVCGPAFCGNGVIEPGEQCDGADLGGQTCQTFGFTGGTLSCTIACVFNTSACTSAGFCNAPGDCPGTDTFCRSRICTGNSCGVNFTQSGIPLPPAQQVTGDCKALVCDGSGNSVSQNDDADLPPPVTCKISICTAGNPNFMNQPDGTECTKPGNIPGLCTAGSCN